MADVAGVPRPAPAALVPAVAAAALVAVGCLTSRSRLGITLDDVGQAVAGLAAWRCCRRVGRHGDGRMWRLAGRASLAWAVGVLVLVGQTLAYGTVARPSPADLAFAAATVYAVRAPFAFPRVLQRRATRGRVVLDGVVVALSALFLVWVLVLAPTGAGAGGSAGTGGGVAIALLYPLVDIVIIAVVVALLARAEEAHALSLALAGLGVVALAATNLVEACLAVSRHVSSWVSPIDLGFVAGLSLVGAGAVLDGVGAPRRLVSRVASAARYLPYLPLPALVVVVWTHREAIGNGPLLTLFACAAAMAGRQVFISAENNALLADHRRAIAALGESEQRYRRIVENSAEGLWLVDADGITRFVNARVGEMIGVEPEAMIGRPALDVLDPMLDDAGRDDVRRRRLERARGDSAAYEFSVVRADGVRVHALVKASPLYDADGNFDGSLTMIADITARKELEDRLVEQARTDVLTGLGNRVLLNAVSQTTLSRVGAALVYCDLDGFKAVNDSLGHAVGDLLLRDVARRLRACLRPGDVIVRLGGDEFAALLPGVLTPPVAQGVADRMLEALAEPFLVDGRRLYVNASIGIALSEPGAGVDQLLRDADLAMYAAKADGRGRSRLYERTMHAAMTHRMQLEQDLRRAVGADELEVWYQPFVRLADGQCVGAEALVRWRHPEHGLLRPDEFMAVAEESGVVVDLERRVLAVAARHAAAWPLVGGQPLTLSLNVAARHFGEGTIAADVAGELAAAGLPAARLLVELTERSLLSGEAARSGVHALHDLGCRIAVDDFGTGYSSIAHLRDFPVDVVKLDRSFVATMTSDLHSARLVSAILQLSQTLGIPCTAEGVETPAQARRLSGGGCSYAQGFLYAPALPAAEFVAWLEQGAQGAAGAGRSAGPGRPAGRAAGRSGGRSAGPDRSAGRTEDRSGGRTADRSAGRTEEAEVLTAAPAGGVPRQRGGSDERSPLAAEGRA